MAQVVIHGVPVRHGEKQEEEEGEVEQEVEGQEEENAQATMRMSMDEMEWQDTDEALSQCESVKRWIMQHIYKRRAVCSVLHDQLVCVRVVHVVGHIGLNVGENVHVVVHIVP